MKRLLLLLTTTCFITFVNAQVLEPAPVPVYTIVEQMPMFPGGDVAMMKYISTNIRYPDLAKACNCSGTLYMSFTVMEDGTLGDIHSIRGIKGCEGSLFVDEEGKYEEKEFKGSYEVKCDESEKLFEAEAKRVIKSMPKWNSGKQNMKPVRVQYNLPIKFTLR